MTSTKWAAPMAVLASFIQVAYAAQPAKHPRLRVLGTYESGLFNVGGAEIPTYDPITRRSFVVNAGSATVDVLDLRNPSKPSLFGSLDIVADLAPRPVGGANSVDARFGILAVAVEADPKQDDGWVAFYSTLTLELIAVVPAGALPDMVTFSENGRYVLAANEGEPDSSYTNDPEGTVTIIDMQRFGQPDFTRTSPSTPSIPGNRVMGSCRRTRASMARVPASPRTSSPSTSRPTARQPGSRCRRTTRSPSSTSAPRA